MARTKSATILEVASLAQVSASTVSNVLNGKSDRMSAETFARVMKAVESLGYAPNQVARSLKTGYVPVIGLIVPSVENCFWGAFARCVEQAARVRHCQVMLCNGERNLAREQMYAESMLSRGIRGLILGSSPLSMSHLTDLARRGLKVVAFDRSPVSESDLEVDSVRVDNTRGAMLAVEHLLELGHRRIGFVSGPINSANRIDRLTAYREALRLRGIEFDPALVWEAAAEKGNMDEEGTVIGRESVRSLLALANPPTALFAINDMTAMGVYAGLRELGLRIPADISVVGFDDIYLCRIMSPALTTIRQPLEQLMEAAVTQLMGRLDGTDTGPAKHVNFSPELVVRASTARAHADAANI